MTAIANRRLRSPKRGELRRYRPSDQPALETFQLATFGPGARQLDPAHTQWLYDENPWRDAEGPQLWVYEYEGAIVGQQGGIPFRLKAGGRELSASWGVELMVAPEWRLRGVGPALSETHAAASDVTLGLGMSEAAYKAYRTAGWIDLGFVPTYFRVLEARRCARALAVRGPFLPVAATLATPALDLAGFTYDIGAKLFGTRLVPIPAFDAAVDELWAAVSPHQPVLARRDLRTLSWRFDARHADRYRRFYLVHRGSVKGYVVLRVDRWAGEPVGVIIDYLARPEWLLPLLAQLTRLARREGLVALLCRTLNEPADRVFKALGFLQFRQGHRTPTRAMARLGETARDAAGLIGDRRNWLITAGDSDTGLRELGP
ncbi:GNAT family N-acetyltransferase [Azospirillum sp.]|uniref:GNAT family N-acetyltransferase n=1 Tax=Azospirillum sp. TaxID=34012 RepID=UPI002D32EE5F|nr:GNAT family N-acetyltransferase [Azospirillum sp.]HYD66572.1 GNAT family N-acetyltransferase [Azospirillum sp.]